MAGTYTITISVDQHTKSLVLTGDDDGAGKGHGKTIEDNKRHQVFGGCNVNFVSKHGDVVIYFKTPNQYPFDNVIAPSETICIAARQGKNTTDRFPLYAKDTATPTPLRYAVVVFPNDPTTGAKVASPIIIDPDLEVGGDGTGINDDASKKHKGKKGERRD